MALPQVGGANGVFAPSCFAHVEGLGVPGSTQINGTTSGQLLGDWFSGRGHPRRLIEAAAPDGQPYNPSCQGQYTCYAALVGRCSPWQGSVACEACARGHYQDLVRAGCTSESEVARICQADEMVW